MRILHTADLHLGRQFNGLSLEADHDAVLSQIVEVLIDMFEVPAAKDESVDSSVTCNELRSAPYKVEFHQAGTKCEEYHDSQS